jgi:acyl-CoA thioesterase-1
LEHEKSGTKWAARAIHYCLTLLGASFLVLVPVACSNEDAGKSPVSTESDRPESTTPTAATTPVRASTLPTPETPALEIRSQAEQPVIVFLGTSLTAGYGLPENQAFPALIGERVLSAGLDYRVINAGVSGDTSAGGLRRLDWLLRLPIAVLVLELGANDMLRGQNVDQLRSNLETILERTRKAHPQVKFLIAGMRAAPNLGRDYGREFDAVYPTLAKRYETSLVPFLLEDVAADRRLNQADGIHPTAEGHALIAERVWTRIEEIIR